MSRQRKPGEESSPSLTEYLVVSDKNSKIVLSTTDFAQIRQTVSLVRKAGGEVTVFKSTKY